MAIKLDKQGMESVISQTKTAQENYNTAISSLKRIIEGLNQVWTGKAQEAMYHSFKDSEKTFQNVAQKLEEYLEAMKTVSNEMSNTDEELVKSIQHLM